jgi:quercetin dioxygenase-like cupin family protein
MGLIKKFTGDWDQVFTWDGTRTRMYQNTGTNQVSETWMIGKKDAAQNFAFRYYQLSPGSHSKEEQHPYDHGILVLQGQGEVLLGEEKLPIARGDIIYIPPDLLHQLTNTGQRPLGFLCVIPARREKGGKTVWAEEGITFNQV